MKKIFKSIATGLKVVGVSAITLSTLGYGYLQYVNSIMGPINIQKDEAISFYKSNHKMTDSQAARTYYWVIYKIAESRIFGFRSYSNYCNKLNQKIISFSLENYQKQQVIQQISKLGPVKSNKSAHEKLFKKIQEIRLKNAENIDERDYVIKTIMKCQKEFNSNVMPGISEEDKEKIIKIHKYINQVGPIFRNSQFLKKNEKMADIEKRFQKDLLYKILFI